MVRSDPTRTHPPPRSRPWERQSPPRVNDVPPGDGPAFPGVHAMASGPGRHRGDEAPRPGRRPRLRGRGRGLSSLVLRRPSVAQERPRNVRGIRPRRRHWTQSASVLVRPLDGAGPTRRRRLPPVGRRRRCHWRDPVLSWEDRVSWVAMGRDRGPITLYGAGRRSIVSNDPDATSLRAGPPRGGTSGTRPRLGVHRR